MPIDDCDDDSESRSLNEVVAKLDAAPGAPAAAESAGMESREYVDFFGKHQADLQTLDDGAESADCDGAAKTE